MGKVSVDKTSDEIQATAKRGENFDRRSAMTVCWTEEQRIAYTRLVCLVRNTNGLWRTRILEAGTFSWCHGRVELCEEYVTCTGQGEHLNHSIFVSVCMPARDNLFTREIENRLCELIHRIMDEGGGSPPSLPNKKVALH